MVVVGDPNQSIYAFRGAVNAMNEFGGERFDLSGSFRFGPSIARVANSVLAMKGKSRRVVGLGGPSMVKLERPVGRHVMLSRTNAGALLYAWEHKDARVLFVGGIAGYWVFRIRDAWRLMNGERQAVMDAEFRDIGSFEGLSQYANEISDVEIQGIVMFVRNYRGQVMAMMDDVEARATVDPAEAGVIVGTAHRSKGLEFDEVALGPFFDFGEFAEARRRGPLDIETIQEVNLLYVAATRARRALSLNDAALGALREYGGGRLPESMRAA